VAAHSPEVVGSEGRLSQEEDEIRRGFFLLLAGLCSLGCGDGGFRPPPPVEGPELFQALQSTLGGSTTLVTRASEWFPADRDGHVYLTLGDGGAIHEGDYSQCIGLAPEGLIGDGTRVYSLTGSVTAVDQLRGPTDDGSGSVLIGPDLDGRGILVLEVDSADLAEPGHLSGD
jgi:hypothetical protein